MHIAFFLLPISREFSNDSINYLQNSLLINSYFYNLDIKFNEPTSYPVLYPLIISFFLSKSESLSIFGCIDRIENCSSYLHEIIVLNLILFILSSIFHKFCLIEG